MTTTHHLSEGELLAALPELRNAPSELGYVRMIVRRLDQQQRELPECGELTTEAGLVGDRWVRTCDRRRPDGSLNPDTQLTLMNIGMLDLLAGGKEHWPLAGDNLLVEFDLSVANLPPGRRLQVGDAIVEITPEPHMGCAKFAARFGRAALAFVNSAEGRSLRLRGANAQVIQPGRVCLGDRVVKL